MSNFLETTCFLIRKDLQSAGINQDGLPVRISINLDSVESFREVCMGDSEELNPDECFLVMRSGDTTVIGMGYNEFKKVMDERRSDKWTSWKRN